MNNDEKKVQQINIELDEKISSGEYANFVVVTHSPARARHLPDAHQN